MFNMGCPFPNEEKRVKPLGGGLIISYTLYAAEVWVFLNYIFLLLVYHCA